MTKLRNPFLITTVKCAAPGCTNIHGKTNHWFAARIDQHRFVCRPYSPATLLDPTDEPICGQACAQKVFERYLARQMSQPVVTQSQNLQPRDKE